MRLPRNFDTDEVPSVPLFGNFTGGYAALAVLLGAKTPLVGLLQEYLYFNPNFPGDGSLSANYTVVQVFLGTFN